MKFVHIPELTRRLLAMCLLLVLLPWIGIAVAAAPLDGQLIEAAKRGDLVQVNSLLEKGAVVDGKDEVGMTALMVVAEAGHVEVVKLLVEKGADVNARAVDDWTVLMSAVKSGRLEIAKLLIENGADVNADTVNIEGRFTPLKIAAYWGTRK